MKKLIALFLTLTLMLTCLLGIALADLAPQIGKLTVGDDGAVTLEVSGEEVREVCVYFQTPEGNWAGNAWLYLDEETGLMTGNNSYYSSYPDAVVSSYELYGNNTYDSQYSEDNKTSTSTNKQKNYQYDADGTLTGYINYNSTDIIQYSEDSKTRTQVYTYTNDYYDADGTLTNTQTTKQETVGEETKWQYKPEGAEDSRECSDYATTSIKSQTEYKYYTTGELTGTTTEVESYQVKLTKVPEREWLDSFQSGYYQDYELISAERSRTEKGTSQYSSNDGEMETTRVADLTTTYTAKEESPSGSDYKYINWQEDTMTGSVQENRKGTETYSWDNTKTQIDETTTTVYVDNNTRTQSKTRNNKIYDLETNELTRVEKEDTKSDLEYKTVEYTWTDSDGETHTSTNSGYALTDYSGSKTTETYTDNQLAATTKNEYDLTVSLKEDATWIPEYYESYYYDVIKGQETAVQKGTTTESWNNTKTQRDETTVTVYGEDKTQTQSRIRNNKIYDIETNKLTRVEKEDTKTELKYTTIEYKMGDPDGGSHTEQRSGYAVTAFSGTVASEAYTNNELSSASEREYDLIVKLRDGVAWIPSNYDSGYYIVLKGKETEAQKYKNEWDTTRYERDSKEESVYLGDDTRMTTRTQNYSYYSKETGNLTSSETRQTQSEYQYEEYSYLSGGETYKAKDWRQKKEHSENVYTSYNNEGKRSHESKEDSNYEYDYVEVKYGDGDNAYSYYNQRTISSVSDTVSHGYYTDTQAVASETVSHDEWALDDNRTVRTEKYTSNTENYSTSGAYNGRRIEERTRTREKGEDNSDTWSDGWTVTNLVSNTKEYNKNDILTYEYAATENKDTENSTSVWRSSTGKVTETRSTTTDKKNGTSSSVSTRFNTYTGQPTYEYTRTEAKDKEGNWKYASQYTYNNDDGSLRRRIVNNADGSVIRYNSSNQVVARKDADGMWTDGAGNKIGLDRDVNINFKQRTGEIDGYGVSASSENEYTYTWYENGKVTYEDKTVYKEDGTVESYENGVLYRSEKDNTTKYYDKKGNLTSSSKYDPEKDETSEFDREGKLTRIYDDHGNETHYDKEGKVLYSQKQEYNKENGGYDTVYSDGEGKEFARLYNKYKSENKDDGSYHRESTNVRIAGEYYYYGEYGEEYAEEYEWWDPESASGKLEKQVSVYDSKDETDPATQEHVSTSTETTDYTKWTVIDGNKTAEVTRSERNESKNGDGYYESRTYKDGVLVDEYRNEWDESGNKYVSKSYDARTGKQRSAYKAYSESDTPFSRHKSYDNYNNLQTYSITDNTDSWNWEKSYYTNGTQAGESWNDDLDQDSSYYARYYLNGNMAYESSQSEGTSHYTNYYENGNKSYENAWSEDSSRTVQYNKDGSYSRWSETNDGTTNTWVYDKKGNLTGYVWNEHYDGDVNSYEVWDAEKLLYTVTSGSENGKYTETCKDPAGNTLVYSNGDYTLTLTTPGDGWQSVFGSWFFLENGAPVQDAWRKFGNDWYYFDESGRMTTGLVADSSTVYAMDNNGTLSTGGWTETAYGWTYTNADGVVTTGWQQIDGKWYYFNDGWSFNESEYQAESEWVQSSYRGIMQTGATKIWNSDWQTQHTYFFNEDGTWDNSPGWKSTNGYNWNVEYHYYDENGTEVTGWKNIDGKWYYFNEDGVMKNGWVGAGSTWYYMEPATGEMATGWVQEKFEDDWFHMDANGVMQTGWQQIDGKWYYFKDDGTMAASEWVGSYYMDENGVMATGWVKDGGKWYYTNAGGVMQTGWQQIDGSWYYFKDNGVMAADELVTGAFNYYMGADGRMCTGWVKGNGKWYHMNSNGIMDTGWLEDGGSWYFLYTEGGIATGQVTIGDKVCIFDANGVWLGYAD